MANGNNLSMVDEAMGAGGPALDPAQEALVQVEGAAPGLTDEALQSIIQLVNEQGMPLEGMEDPTEVLTEEYSHTANLAEILDPSVLGEISSDLMGLVDEDLESRSEWEEALEKGLGLLGINYEERDEPFAGASGVTHPLISESVTQFQAQAYKEMVPAGGPVRVSVVGMQTPEVLAQATRVKDFMNYYVTEIMEEFDPDMDQMLFHLPITGSTFKKVYFDYTKMRATSMFVPAEDLIVPYSASDIRTAERVTHVVRMSDNKIAKMVQATVYRDVDLGSSTQDDSSPLRDRKDELQGTRSSYQDEIHTLYEIYTNLDLPGFEDMDMTGEPTGVKLPYVVTINKSNGEILSIVRNWEEEDPYRKAMQVFVHYKFLPGFGFYGFGLIHMIGGLSRAATSILRQLIDAGTLANLPAGFKARGVRIRNDDEPLNPGEFRDIDAPAGDIRNAIIPLPYKEPSGTLGQLLGLLVDSGRRFASIADNVADVNPNAPVGTTVALLERGSRVMSAIHKRMHYAQRQEFRLLAQIIGDTVETYPYQMDVPPEVIAQDFDGRIDVLPVSDPNIFSMAQRMSLAQTQLQMATQNPEIHNLREAYRRMYDALEVKNIDALLPPPPQPQPVDPAMELSMLLSGQPVEAFPGQQHDAHIQNYVSALKLPMVMQMPPIMGQLYSLIFKRIGMKANEQAQQMVMQQVNPMMLQQNPQMQQQVQMQVMQMATQLTTQMIAQVMPQLLPPPEQDPLVTIRQQELMLQAQDQQRKAQKDQVDASLEQQRLQQAQMNASNRLAAQLKIAEDRNDVNMTRIETQEDIAVMRELNKARG